MASPVTQRLGGEAFDGGEELDGDRFLRLIIPGRSAIRGKLISEQEIAELGYSPYVATTIRVDSGGEPLETYLDVGQETQGKRQKFSAHRIFAGCVSPDTKILLGKLDFSLFNFPPSSNHSDWLNATELGLAFQKKNNRSLGEYSSEEWSTQGVGDFSLKLVINATEEVGVASIRVMALPLPVERLGELPGGNAKDTRSYPAIDVFSNPFEFQMLPQNFEPLRNDGLPVLPFILYQGGPGTQPTSLDTGKLLRCMYAVWSNDAGARGVTAQVLAKLLESLPLDTSPVAAEWAWPRLEQEEDNSEILDSDESDCVVDDDDNYAHYMAGRESRADAAEVARLARLANGGGGRPPITPVVRTSTMAGGMSRAIVTMASSSSTSTVTSVVSTFTIPRMSSSAVASKRSTPAEHSDGGPGQKKTRLSQLLLKKDWPEGYDADAIDAIGDINAINAIKDREIKLKKTEKRNRPGVRPGIDIGGVIPTVDLPHNGISHASL